jgi:hypothetical protein
MTGDIAAVLMFPTSGKLLLLASYDKLIILDFLT